MKDTVSYSHAAPVLREKLIRACGRAAAATTQRDRMAYYQEAYAYGAALDVLWRSDDGSAVADTPGIFQPWAIPSDAWQAAADFLKLNADRLLGEGWMEARREQPTPVGDESTGEEKTIEQYRQA